MLNLKIHNKLEKRMQDIYDYNLDMCEITHMQVPFCVILLHYISYIQYVHFKVWFKQ